MNKRPCLIFLYYVCPKYFSLSVVGIAIRLRAERGGFESRKGQEVFLFVKTSKPALETNQAS